eukprot:4800697-Alexandrium_andersonii.AAC.1
MLPRPRLVAGPLVVRTPRWTGGGAVAGSWPAVGHPEGPRTMHASAAQYQCWTCLLYTSDAADDM